ncbi:MAG: ubiquinol-cytochrome c reductase iron-sulfur subunit, partial [Haliea sp.]|nr:ubiquinol-cytochrome c reductase iron-sulfur subunit [Haliea sp.]
MSSDGVNTGRRRFLTAATSVVGVAGAVGIAVPFVGSWNPSAKAKAAGAPVKADISKLEPGQMVVVEWRGKPVYVVHRTESQLASLDLLTGELKDPESLVSSQPDYIEGAARALRPEMLVVEGLCTHLGCAPKFRPEVGAADLGGDAWLGGFFCPCHGSKFDLSGRVYAGVPASTNL